MAEIYALYSTRDGRVRYVGQSGDSAARFKEHLRSDNWFHHEWQHGYLVRYAVLEACDYDKRHEVETKWIWRFPSSDLLNLRKRRPGWQIVRPPVIHEIDKYMRRHMFNVEGFRGVCYDCQVGYYRVLLYNGRWVEWLKGDELPGGSESIWFSDLARAVDAIDKHFKRFRFLIRSGHNRALMRARRRDDTIASVAQEQERIQKEGESYVW
jgi:hypothetical protein